MEPESTAPHFGLKIVESASPAEVGRLFRSAGSSLVVGRSAECAAVINDTGVSRVHAELAHGEEGFVLTDRDSVNGLWVGEQRVRRCVLVPGQRFRVGQTVLEFVLLSSAPEPAVAAALKSAGTRFVPSAARPAPEADSGIGPLEGPRAEDKSPADVGVSGGLGPPPPESAADTGGPLPGPAAGTRDRIVSSAPAVTEARPVPTALAGALAGEGERIAASGNHPFLLDDSATAWVVETGKVEIFTVAVADAQPVGARSHYLSVEPGQGFFGMDLRRYGAGFGFLAVGRMGTWLRRIPLARLHDMAAEGHGAEELAELMDGWIAGLSKRLTAAVVPGPLVDVNLEEEAEATLKAGQKARSSKGVLWLRGRGKLLFVGMEALTLDGRTFFPIVPDTWVEASGLDGTACELTARPSPRVLAQPATWRGLDRLHEAVCQCEFIHRRLAIVDELHRLKSKAEYSEAAREAALRDITAVLEHEGRRVEARTEEEEADPVLSALRLVGRAQGVRIIAHPEVKEALSYEERVAAIAKASGLRTRTVALRDAWWTQDQGPILARFEDRGDPVALLPRGPRAYECVDPDPVGEKRRPVTEDLAAELNGFGYVLYRPFPDGELTARDLIRFGARGLARDFLTVILMGTGVGLLGALTPHFTGRIFDSAIPEAERGLLAQFTLALVVAAAASAAFKITQSIAVLRVQGKMDYSVQAALWDRLLNLPSTFFRRFSAGDLADRAAGINAIRGLVADAGVASILGALSSVFYVALMFWYSVQLAVLAMVLTFLFVGFTSAANYWQLRFQRRQFEIRGRLTGIVLQLVSAVGKLRVAGAENHAFRVWARQFSEQRRISFRIGRIQNSVAVFNSGFPVLSSMAIFYALVAVQSKAQAAGGASGLTTGEFIAFSAAYGMFVTAMQALSDASLNLLRAVPTYERLRPIITTPAELDETKAYPGKLKGKIELSHLHFRYQEDGPWIIRDVSLRIEPGEFVAFVGASGSGKSTLMRLMLGFEIPEKGSVYYDGQDLGNLDLREVRQQLGVVLQESRVLPADIFRNIVGTTSRTLDEAWEAARMAGLDGDVRQMPMGMHTYVSEGGGGFSGGQLQRLLIARAVVNKPRIIFMDEATSALDNRTQAIVTESLDRLQASRVVIAHRLSTIINADRICFLEAGVIRELGSYGELMAQDGLFAQLARRQMA